MTIPAPIYIFTDLDDSLFQTRAKCPPDSALFTAALDRDGDSLSYSTAEQRALIALLGQGALIPVTGRNAAALARVQIDFPSYRVVSHGALVLDADDRPDPAWLAAIEAQLGAWHERMNHVCEWLRRRIDDDNFDARCRVIEDRNLPVYVSVKGDENAIQRLAREIQPHWREDGARVHHNGHNMALLPPFADKAQAVQFVMARLCEDGARPLFIGVGDSATDLPFLRLCHYALIPQHSQIQAQTWRLHDF